MENSTDLAVSRTTARNYVGDILAKRREERAAKAFRLSSLGWAKTDIATALGVTTETLRLESQNMKDLTESAIGQLSSGLPIDEVAQRHGLPLQLVWAMACQRDDSIFDSPRSDKVTACDFVPQRT